MGCQNRRFNAYTPRILALNLNLASNTQLNSKVKKGSEICLLITFGKSALEQWILELLSSFLDMLFQKVAASYTHPKIRDIVQTTW